MVEGLGVEGGIVAEMEEQVPVERAVIGQRRPTPPTDLVALITELRTAPHPFLVGLANLPLLSEREYAEALRARLTRVEVRIAGVAEAEQAQAPSRHRRVRCSLTR